MKISFCGACREVTGSCVLIETDSRKFLVDCGMYQGIGDYEKNSEDFPFDPKTVDFVLLSHAHADHCGRLPKLWRDGFRGKIFCTKPTAGLAELIMYDSAKIAIMEQGRTAQAPLYNDADV
ncbi:MAG: MBL fold metallo-hydrolase, partial [Candidatus Pacebacteria bacterium]|nr:MBL fold metallo-hydrolase [Candidatus Paceibacterota bacterium]